MITALCPLCGIHYSSAGHACSTVKKPRVPTMGIEGLKDKVTVTEIMDINGLRRLKKIQDELKEYFRTRVHLRRGRLWKAYQETL